MTFSIARINTLMEMNFKLWLEKKERKEGIGSKIMALALPMGSALAGGAAGLALGGPLAAIPSGVVAKEIARKAVEKFLPQSALYHMRKK